MDTCSVTTGPSDQIHAVPVRLLGVPGGNHSGSLRCPRGDKQCVWVHWVHIHAVLRCRELQTTRIPTG